MNQLALTPDENETLALVVRAGRAGVELGDRLPLSMAVRFELSWLVEIRTEEGMQTAYATRKGQAFAHRVVR